MSGEAFWDIFICKFPGPSGGWVVSTLDQDGMSPEPGECFDLFDEALQFARSIVPDGIPATIHCSEAPGEWTAQGFPESHV